MSIGMICREGSITASRAESNSNKGYGCEVMDQILFYSLHAGVRISNLRRFQNGGFETYPSWEPVVDDAWHSCLILLDTLRFDGFDHSASWATRVRNVSRLRSQYLAAGSAHKTPIVNCHLNYARRRT